MTTKITSANIDATVASTTSLNTATAPVDTNAFNISLLGFKMAVNEGLTIFNLVDGVVDEFNDESGTDEAEGSNDLYCGTSDYYINSNSPDGSPIAGGTPYSAGFTVSSITEPDTSTAGTNPIQGTTTFGSFTVPSGLVSLNTFVWGAGAGSGVDTGGAGGGGGYAEGTLAVTPGQTIYIGVGEHGERGTSTLNPGCGVLPYPSTAPIDGYGNRGGGFANGGLKSTNNNNTNHHSVSGAGASGIGAAASTPQTTAPQVYVVAGGGGGGAYTPNWPSTCGAGGAGGGLTGCAGGQNTEQTNFNPNPGDAGGGGGGQSSGGQGAPDTKGTAQSGGFLVGGNAVNAAIKSAGGGGGYYGGGGGSGGTGVPTACGGAGGGGSSYYGHPQITSGSTEEGNFGQGGGISQPNYVGGTNEGVCSTVPYGPVAQQDGEDGYVLLTGTSGPICATATSTTIVSTAFTSTSVATSSRIVVFEEDVDTPTLNTDIVASVSRDGGATFTNATLSDSGYVTGSSGQRILTGQADISGQPSGQSMRWKLALANNQVKIHGVSLQWS